MAENIVARRLEPEAADRIWAADITYVEAAEGRLYPAVVLDLLSRRVNGWAAADHLRAEPACEAPGRASEGRRPAGERPHPGGRGARYAGAAYQAIPARLGAGPSTSRAGDGYDAAVTGSFFSGPKGEWTRHES